MYQFLRRELLEWVLLLPLAVSAYLMAYTYSDFFDYFGPEQEGGIRNIFSSAKEESPR
jgi:iron(III) transport system permease protein